MSQLEEEGHTVDEAEPSRFSEVGEDRDRAADERDRQADLRDSEADLRDAKAVARELDINDDVPGSAEERRVQREAAIADRLQAADDRRRARYDRQVASADRASAAAERRSSCRDDLTGAYRRGAGLQELEREADRARRERTPFTIAFIDIDGLKVINDEIGHDAGDQVLREVTELLRKHFRPYDLIVRYGGDEFVCALWGTPLKLANERFELMNSDIGSEGDASISVGLASLEGDEDLDSLINRADQQMYENRNAGTTEPNGETDA